jgi:hypothetical protein
MACFVSLIQSEKRTFTIQLSGQLIDAVDCQPPHRHDTLAYLVNRQSKKSAFNLQLLGQLIAAVN